MKYGVINKATGETVGEYTGEAMNYADPFGPHADVVHFEITEGQYLEGYSLNTGHVAVYDTNYVPYKGTYKVRKAYDLLDIRDGFNDMALRFAAENSEILNAEIKRLAIAGLLDPTDKAALSVFVRSKLDPLVDTLHHLMSDMDSFYTWRIEGHLAAIVRDDLIATEERITAFKDELLAMVGN